MVETSVTSTFIYFEYPDLTAHNPHTVFIILFVKYLQKTFDTYKYFFSNTNFTFALILKIEQDLVGNCNDAASYCGIKDRLYPDRRSMGYPFDRVPRDGVDTLQQFLTSNMRVQDVTIQFSGRTLRPRARQ